MYIRKSILLVFFFLFISCKREIVCPAYQSFFLIDQKEAHKNFSTFYLDSIPKTNKQRLFRSPKYKREEKLYRRYENYGIQAKIKDSRKFKNHLVVSMDMILPTPLDSAEMDTLWSNIDQKIYDELFNEVNKILLARRKKEQGERLKKKMSKKELIADSINSAPKQKLIEQDTVKFEEDPFIPSDTATIIEAPLFEKEKEKEPEKEKKNKRKKKKDNPEVTQPATDQ